MVPEKPPAQSPDIVCRSPRRGCSRGSLSHRALLSVTATNSCCDYALWTQSIEWRWLAHVSTVPTPTVQQVDNVMLKCLEVLCTLHQHPLRPVGEVHGCSVDMSSTVEYACPRTGCVLRMSSSSIRQALRDKCCVGWRGGLQLSCAICETPVMWCDHLVTSSSSRTV